MQAQEWERARMHGAALLSQYPDTATAEKLKAGYEEVKAKADALNETRRLAGAVELCPVAHRGRHSALGLDLQPRTVDVGVGGAQPVQLVFRDHPQWKRSSYLVLRAGEFPLPRGCKVKVTVDGAAAKSMAAWRPDTDEAIAMFINDQKALWRLLRKSRWWRSNFGAGRWHPHRRIRKRRLDGAQMPGWD